MHAAAVDELTVAVVGSWTETRDGEGRRRSSELRACFTLARAVGRANQRVSSAASIIFV